MTLSSIEPRPSGLWHSAYRVAPIYWGSIPNYAMTIFDWKLDVNEYAKMGRKWNSGEKYEMNKTFDWEISRKHPACEI
jgi:hypothetical protein